MKNKIYNLESYSFSSGEQVLVDANIWIYLFPAPSDPNQRFGKQYSSAFSALIKSKAEPILDPMILSEYLNRYCRIEWEGNYKSKYPKFKDFRNSSDFSVVALSVKTYASEILDCCKIHSIPANEIDLVHALADFTNGDIDFNDAVLVDICKKRNLKLMTNDGDFQKGGIEILTINPRLLRA